MKVLLIDVYHYNKGGAETVCFNTGRMLKENGHDVVYFALKWKKNLPSPHEKYFPESKETRKGPLRQFINLRNYFYYPDAARKLEKLILDEKPDIAHIHLLWGQISPSIFPVLKKYDIPIIFTMHDYRIVCPGYLFKNGKDEICEKCDGKKFFQCFFNKCAKGKYSLSFFMALEQYFRNTFFNPSQYINGILYVSRFSQRKHEQYMPQLKSIPNIVMHNFSLNIEDEVKGVNKEKYFLFLGRLSKEKGIETLVKAFKRCPNSKLIVAGTGPLENELIKFKTINNIENIDFVGYKSGDELEKLKKYAYFIIVPSECYENNPMAIIEGYSKGVPSIGSNIGGIPEIILQDKTGFVFDMGNVDDLSIIINKANNLSDKEYQEMRINSIKYALEDMSSKSYYNKLLPFYYTVIKQVKSHNI